MKNRALAIVTFFVVYSAMGLGVVGCAGMSGAPAWVNGETPAEFPKDKFVSALGTGESLSSAQIASKSELSRVFSARLASEIELIDQDTVIDGRQSQSSDLMNTTNITTDLELQGVEVPMHWRDPKTGEIWALAVLERRKECMRIRSEGSDLIAELDAHARESRSAKNLLVAIRASANAVRLGVTLDGLQARSRVLGSQCLTPRSVSTGQLRGEAADRLHQISFVVRTSDLDGNGNSNGPLPQLREQIASNLSKLGFQVGPAVGALVVPIDARLRLSRVARGTEWIEYRYEGSAEVGSPVPGAPAMIAVETDGAESHPEPSSARLRARRSGEKDLAHKLNERIKLFLSEAAGG